MQQLAPLDDADLVAHVGQLRQDVAADHDRLAHRAELFEQLANFDPRPRVQAAGRFVEQQHLRIVQQHAGQAEALVHAAREAGGQRVALVAQLDQLEHLVAFLAARRAVDAIRGGEKLQVLDHLHVVIDAEQVGHVADQAADFLGVRVDRMAADIRLAPGRVEQRGEHPHRRRLAGAVGADEAEDIARAQA